MIGEFFLEDGILVYEIGRASQENVTDTLGGSRVPMRQIHTLKDMEENRHMILFFNYFYYSLN